VNAEVARGKAAGFYIEQKIIRTGKLEDLSTEELESRMKQIIDEYFPNFGRCRDRRTSR
jgi:hypothetical protein